MEKKIMSGHNRHESPVQSHVTPGRKTRLNDSRESNLDSSVGENSGSPKRRRNHSGLSNRKSEQLKATTNKTPDTNNIKRSKRSGVTLFKSYNISDKAVKDLNGTSSFSNTSTNETGVSWLGKKNNNVTSKSRSSEEILGESEENDSIGRKIARDKKKNKGRNRFSVGMKPVVRKMSKSPKIVLKLSKSKSKSKLALKMKKARSPSGKLIGNKSLPSIYTKEKAELVKRSSISLRRKSDSDGTKVKKRAPDILSLGKLSLMKNKFLLKEAVVELQKLPDDISTVSALALSYTPTTSKEKRKVSNKSPKEQPLRSSTPRNEKHRQCKMEKKLRNCEEWRKESVKSSKSDTREENGMEMEDEDGRGKNDTYELKEAKTPNLRRKVKEEEEEGGSSTKKRTAKKNAMVRFTRLSTGTNKSYNTRLRTSISGKDDEDVRKKEIFKTPISGFRKRSKSGGDANTSTVRSFPRFSPGNRKSSSIINLNVSSTSRLGSPRKTPDAKHSETKKVPNFSKIHGKMFAKSESVVDAKKRLEKRHTALTGTKAVHSTRIKTDTKEESELENGGGRKNRFGFRLRKNDATEYILKKTTNIHSTRSKQLQQNRAILKGVRINRRFELQMKARNINR